MKIRTGFVSNSSSSSFVMVGIKLTAEVNTQMKETLLNKYNITDEEGDYEALYKFNKQTGNKLDRAFEVDILGVRMASWEYNITNFSIQDVEKAIEKCKSGFEDLGLNTDNIKIWAGTESC